MPHSVIPAEAGIQCFRIVTNSLDSGFHRSDDFLRLYQLLIFPQLLASVAFLLSLKSQTEVSDQEIR